MAEACRIVIEGMVQGYQRLFAVARHR